ncbi:hypothetical protein COJ85_06105 [Bacillus sp. AFS076308]|nr:hypothetical protein COJ85_06105 [Bacillus sp. AFS076308]
MRVTFRHGKGKKIMSCPKAGHLQTRGGQKIVVLSECGSPSDRRKAKTVMSCPKAGHLRTREALKIVVLSEGRSPSDKGSLKIVFLSEGRSPSDKGSPKNSRPVRRQVTFRQGEAPK